MISWNWNYSSCLQEKEVKLIFILTNNMNLNMQCLSLTYRTQHGGWRWQSLIVQFQGSKSKAVPRCIAAYNWVKLQRKIIMYRYLITWGCWKCCPPSSTHFWHLFRKCAFTWIKSISEIQSISRLILVFNSSNVWGVFDFYLWGHLKNKVYAMNPHTLEELKASIRCEIHYFGNY